MDKGTLDMISESLELDHLYSHILGSTLQYDNLYLRYEVFLIAMEVRIYIL